MKISKKKIIFTIIISTIVIGLFLLYGPYSYIRDTLITTAMTSKNHQYLATWFYSDETIQKVLDKNKIEEVVGITKPELIDMSKTYNASVYDKQILTKDKGNDLYKVLSIKGLGYRGYLVAIYDPSKVVLATSKYLGNKGQTTLEIAKDYKAKVVINASGFYDLNFSSEGGMAHGTVIKDGKVISDYSDAPVGGGFIGFNYDNKLILGKMTTEEALTIKYRDAIEFGPFLIVNGKASFISGNGGWGIAPRTAIGQRKDGIVLLVVIDGRIVSSIGADMLDLTKIMQRYGAYNAANLDGGSSTSLVINNKIINHPVASGKNGLRKLPTFWMVKE